MTENKELARLRQPKQFLIDKNQTKKYYNLITHNRQVNHQFQGFLKDGNKPRAKPTRHIDVKDPEHLVSLCEKYNPKGMLCLSVNPTKPGVMKFSGIIEIANVIIDADVKNERKKNGVSTPEDKKIAYTTMQQIRKKFEEEINLRFSAIPDSGNGYHGVIPLSISLDGLFTGKNEDENSLNNGYFINDICFVTFSKSAPRDAIKRITFKFPLVKLDDIYYHATIHGICKRLLGWDLHDGSSTELETQKHRHDFLQQYGLNYPIIDYRHLDDIPEISLPEDTIDATDEEKIFQVINYCHHRCLPLDRWRDSGIIFHDIIPDDVTFIASNWRSYKEKHGLVGFDDMLMETLKDKLYPPTEILFVDEFQDLSPLLFKVIKSWMPYVDKVTVAGDDDQTIYAWTGASPDFLLNLSGKKTILDYSYRVPYVILEKAQKLINTVQKREYKNFKVNEKQGQFYCLSSPAIQDILDVLSPNNSVFFLFRTNFLAKTFVENYLIPYGIPYQTIRRRTIIPNSWTFKLVNIRNAVVKIRLNQKLSEMEVSEMVRMLPSCSKGKLDGVVRYGMKTYFKKSQQKKWSVRDLLNTLFTRLPPWNSRLILSNLKEMQRRAYIMNIESNRWMFCPSKIKVGTIHSANGLEADMVFLFNNHSGVTEDDILEKGQSVIDAEKRLHYVGITRAKETLIIIDNFFNTYTFDLGGLI